MLFKEYKRKVLLRNPKVALRWFEWKLWRWLTKREIKRAGVAETKEWVNDLAN